MNANEHDTNGPDTNDLEAELVLEQLRPRMRTARIGHLRRMVTLAAIVPLLGFGAVAMAAEGGDVTVDAASAPATDGSADVGSAGNESAGVDLGAASDATVTTTSSTTSTTSTTSTAIDPTGEKTLVLGEFGTATVVPEGDAFALASIDTAAGWELISAEIIDGTLVIVISDGEHVKAIKITPGVRDRIEIRIIDVVIPPPTTKPPSTTAAPVVDRLVVEVPGKGSFVVERSGDVLYLGNVTDAEGYTHEVIKAEGWKVYVAFTDGSWLWYGKAYIDDNGNVRQLFWDEEKIADPVYQWVEIPGVGAAKFKLWDGQVYVKETSPAAGFSAYVHTSVGATVKVEFEGEGQLWFIDVGIVEGEMVWETTNSTPTPTTTEPPPEEPPTTTVAE